MLFFVPLQKISRTSLYGRNPLQLVLACCFGVIPWSLAFGDVSPKGLTSTNVQGTYSEADGVWKGKTFTSYNKGRVRKLEGIVSQSVGISQETQMDWHIAYAQAKIVKSDTLGLKKGSSRSGVQEAGFHLTRKLYMGHNLGVNGIAGFRAAGNDASGNEILSLNDNATKYDAGLALSYSIEDSVRLGLKYQHSRRPSKYQSPTNLLEISASYSAEWGTLSAFGGWFSTVKGLDLGSPAFAGRLKKIGEPPFSEVKESYKSAGLSYQLPITDALGISVFYSKKLSGANTDRSQGVGLGLTHYCWQEET
jgi:hypothetical protein